VHHAKGVLTAVSNVNNVIAPAVIAKNIDPANQKELDDLLIALDGTHNKGKLGMCVVFSINHLNVYMFVRMYGWRHYDCMY
jgi:enolase